MFVLLEVYLDCFTVQNTFELSKGIGNMHYSIKNKSIFHRLLAIGLLRNTLLLSCYTKENFELDLRSIKMFKCEQEP